MKFKALVIFLFIILSYADLFAYKLIEDIATKAGGYDIPIKIALPENSAGKMPVMFFVHGGGWNGGDENKVPDASLPADCEYLCDQMGIIYVGLAYRCKGNNGTFHLALQDLETSIKWFVERTGEFNADTSRIGFSGASAGTTLSAVLAQRYPNCVLYVGREGMYNVLDLDSTLSHFPDAQSRADFGLISHAQKLEASPYYNLRNKPAFTLLFNGMDDWLCNYTQSVKYKEQIETAGGSCKLVLYKGINHTCLNINYPDVFKNSMKEISRHYAVGYGIENVDFKAIDKEVNKRTRFMYPYDNIPETGLLGSWENQKYGTLTFNENGEGEYISRKGAKSEPLTYQNNGSWFSVRIWGESKERTFYLRMNDNSIYELITENNRYKSRRNDYRKL